MCCKWPPLTYFLHQLFILVIDHFLFLWENPYYEGMYICVHNCEKYLFGCKRKNRQHNTAENWCNQFSCWYAKALSTVDRKDCSGDQIVEKSGSSTFNLSHTTVTITHNNNICNLLDFSWNEGWIPTFKYTFVRHFRNIYDE